MVTMKNLRVFSICLLFTPPALAQSLADLPTCAQEAALAGITSTGCQVTDIACVCKSVPFLQALRSTITTTCSPTEQAQALIFAQTLCSSVGIAIDVPPIPGASSVPASVATTSPSATAPPTTSAPARSRPTGTTSAVGSVTAAPLSSSIPTDASSVSVTSSDTPEETAAVPFTGTASPMAKLPGILAAVAAVAAVAVVAALGPF